VREGGMKKKKERRMKLLISSKREFHIGKDIKYDYRTAATVREKKKKKRCRTQLHKFLLTAFQTATASQQKREREIKRESERGEIERER
jgi:hypothetical protein